MTENLASLLLGALLGASLDLAGFGSPRKLNAQFLLRDFSMFKVMFGAIVVAAALYLAFVEAGWPGAPKLLAPSLDAALLAGGFLLGVGLVLGGYCPGTALAGAGGGRLDAVVFFAMMYPGYRFWIWLEPWLPPGLHAPLAPRNLSLPDALGVHPAWIVAVLALACFLGWKFGDWLEARTRRALPAGGAHLASGA